MKKLFILFLMILTTNAYAGFGWFVLGAMAASSSTNVEYGSANSGRVFVTMTTNTEKCQEISYTKPKERKVAISLNLILKVSEIDNDCLKIMYSSASGNQFLYVKDKFSNFQKLLMEIKEDSEDIPIKSRKE